MWPVIKFAIEESIPPITGESPNKINLHLSAMLSGQLDVWAAYDRENNKFEAVVVTELLEDIPSGTRSLLIYSLYGYSRITEERWKEGSIALAKYAVSKGCSRILAYTDNEHLINIAKNYGATINTFIAIDLVKLLT
jgi:hypothetical protein